MLAAETNALEHLLAAHRLYGYDKSEILNGIANCHQQLEEYERAVSFYQKSRNAARSEGSLEDELRATVNLSQAYFCQGAL